MARRIHLTAVLFLIFQAPMFGANEWSAIIARLEASVVTVTGKEGGWCSAWVVDETRDFAATMFHCKSEDMMVDGIPATIAKQEPKRDLLVLHVPNLDKPALPLASGDPARGDAVACLGYGYGLETPMLRVGTVGDVNTDVEERGWPGPLVSLDIAFEGGMSGGPCVNKGGEVVMAIKGSTDRRGVGPGAKIIKDRIGSFLQKPKP